MKKEFIQGIKAGIPICLGYFSVSTAFGLTACMSGIPVWSAVLISLTNLTSAGQFAGIGIIAAYGSIIELALTTFIINLRYALMSISVSQKLSEHFTFLQRLIISFGITDEIFAVSVQREKEITFPYMTGLIATPVIGWTLGTLVGAVASSLLPQVLSSSLSIALYGMFIAIIIPPVKKEKNVLFVIVASVLASVAFTYIPFLNSISTGWSIIIIAVVVCAVAAFLFPVDSVSETREPDEDTGAGAGFNNSGIGDNAERIEKTAGNIRLANESEIVE